MRARGMKDNMEYLNKEYEKFAIDILKHYRELKLFINSTSGKNVLNIKELIKLRYLEGLDWQSTSESLGCSIRTAHNRNKEAVNIIVQNLFGENIERNNVN